MISYSILSISKKLREIGFKSSLFTKVDAEEFDSAGISIVPVSVPVHPGHSLCPLYQQRLLQHCLMVGLVFLLFGCATPNVKPFAEQTAKLATSISMEQKAAASEFVSISTRLKKLANEAHRAKKKDLKTALLEKKDKLDKQKQKITAYDQIVKSTLQKAVEYSDQLASLAEAGENGSDAAGALIGTVNEFASLGGLGTGLVTGSVAQALKLVGELHVRKEAQDSLETATRAAQPAVNALADVVIAIYDINGPYYKIVTGLEVKAIAYLRDDAGIHTIGFYNKIDIMRDELFFKVKKHMARFDAKKGFCVDGGGKQQKSCFAARDIQTVADLNRMMQQVEPVALKFEADKKEIKRRFSRRMSHARMIVKAVKQWRVEHQKIAGILEKCGGMKFQQCQSMSVGNLKTLVSELREKLKAEDK